MMTAEFMLSKRPVFTYMYYGFIFSFNVLIVLVAFVVSSFWSMQNFTRGTAQIARSAPHLYFKAIEQLYIC